MFDAEKRLVVCNDRYAKMYQLPPELLRAGTSHREIIEHRISNGILKGETNESAASRCCRPWMRCRPTSRQAGSTSSPTVD